MQVTINMCKCTINNMMLMDENVSTPEPPVVNGSFIISVATSIGIKMKEDGGEMVLQLCEFSLDGPIWNFIATSDGSTSISSNSTGLYWTSAEAGMGFSLILKPASNSEMSTQRFILMDSGFDNIYYAMDSQGRYVSFSSIPAQIGDYLVMGSDMDKRAPLKLEPAP